MNKIELGWTFGKVCVWVAGPGWRVGLPCYLEAFFKDSNEKQTSQAQTHWFLLTPIQLSLSTAALLGSLLNCSQECWGDPHCTDRPRSLSPSYSQTLVFFFREYRMWSTLSSSFRASHLPFSSEKAVLSAWLVKRGWFVVVNQNLFSVVFRCITKINGHAEEVRESLSLENIFQRGCKLALFCDLYRVMSEGRRICDSEAPYDPDTLRSGTFRLS